MIGRGARRALGVSGSRGADAAPGGPGHHHPVAGRQAGRDTSAGLSQASPPLPETSPSSHSALLRGPACSTDEQSTRTCTRGVEPGPGATPLTATSTRASATRGERRHRGPSPADEGAWPPDGVDAAEAGRGRKAALWAWSPAFPTAGSGCPLGPPACEKGGKQRPKRPCVLTSITLTC